MTGTVKGDGVDSPNCFICGRPAVMENGSVIEGSKGFKCKSCFVTEFKALRRFLEVDQRECSGCRKDMDPFDDIWFDTETEGLICGFCKKTRVKEMHGA